MMKGERKGRRSERDKSKWDLIVDIVQTAFRYGVLV